MNKRILAELLEDLLIERMREDVDVDFEEEFEYEGQDENSYLFEIDLKS